MKKILLLLLVAGLIAGCNKDDASHNDSFYFMCKIDGVDKTFSANMFGYKETNGTNYGYILGGFSDASNDAESFGIVVNNVPGQKDITTRTYADSDTEFQVLTTYLDTSGVFYEAGTPVYAGGLNDDAIATHFQVVISSLSTDAIAGTFKGSYYAEGDVTAPKKEITEGKFRIKLTPP